MIEKLSSIFNARNVATALAGVASAVGVSSFASAGLVVFQDLPFWTSFSMAAPAVLGMCTAKGALVMILDQIKQKKSDLVTICASTVFSAISLPLSCASLSYTLEENFGYTTDHNVMIQERNVEAVQVNFGELV